MMYNNIEEFYATNHFKLIEDKSDESLRPVKSYTKDVENCVEKFRNYYTSNQTDILKSSDLNTIIGELELNTRTQNLRVMREFGFLEEMEETIDSQSVENEKRYKFTQKFKEFATSDQSIACYILESLYNIRSMDDMTMYYNLLLSTLREAYTFGEIIIFKDSDEKFQALVPDSQKRYEYRKRIYDIYGFSSRGKEVTDDYTPNISYMSQAELKNLGLVVDSAEKKDGFKTLVLTPNGYHLLKAIDENLGNVDDESDSSEKDEIFNGEINFNTGLSSRFDRNRIVFGAPGTGKSHDLGLDASELTDGNEKRMERVTFHPDYSYSQFVGAYKPVMKGDDIRYEFVPGPFMRIYAEAIKSAIKSEQKSYLLLIEEINRAQVAAVFGDVFQLLDRADNGVSEYDIQASNEIKKYLGNNLKANPECFNKIRIPDNMFIWATMNSADQGVFPMDTAFKRRWSFDYIGIDKGESDMSTGMVLLGVGEDAIEVDWNRLRKAINTRLSSKDFKVNEDKLMGPFFLSKKVTSPMSNDDSTMANPEEFKKAFKNKVLMYLYEDAEKQHRDKFFAGCDSSKYSAICDAFDKIGIKIFGDDFLELYAEQE